MKKLFLATIILFVSVSFANSQHWDLKGRYSLTKCAQVVIDVTNGVARVTRTDVDYSLLIPSKTYNLPNLEFDDNRYFILPDAGNYFFIPFSDSHPIVNLRQIGGGCDCYCHGSTVEDHTCEVNVSTNDCMGGCTSCLGNSFWANGSNWKDGSGVVVKADRVEME